MKKLVLTLVACLACVQAQAAVSPLAESLLEYDAITSALGTPDFENVIPPNEFIVDIQRTTRQINVLGTVEYEIVTRYPRSDSGELPEASCHSHHHHHHHHHHHRNPLGTHLYLVTLDIVANPEIGPNIITVVGISPITGTPPIPLSK